MVSVDISSPCYYARLLRVPQVIFRVRGSTLNDPHVPNFSGVPMTDDHQDLAAALGRLATTPIWTATAATDTALDGHASRRIVDELQRMAG